MLAARAIFPRLRHQLGANAKFVSWDKRFVDPIAVPGRKPLVTLRDAAQYITKLPKAEHDADEWQAAMEALLLIAEQDGPPVRAHRYHESDQPARRARV
jgi:hypothetical protein